ncbi:MAG: biotin--[acetyl-CoA-carboxylase] ligase [Candidatus Scalindua sp.]
MSIEQKPEIVKPDKAVYTIYRYAELDSTNAFLKQHCSSLPDYSVIWANEQSQGRGRFTRIWNSEPGRDLTFSILLPLTSLEHKLRQNITQIAALSVAQMLEGFGLKPSVKWPNDVLIHGKKYPEFCVK